MVGGQLLVALRVTYLVVVCLTSQSTNTANFLSICGPILTSTIKPPYQHTLIVEWQVNILADSKPFPVELTSHQDWVKVQA